MSNLLVIIFIITLVYISVASWLQSYIKALIIQGAILCVVTLMELKEMNVSNLVFVFVETLVFKAVVVPVFLYRLIQKNNLKTTSDSIMPGFYSLIIVTLGIVLSFIISHSLNSVDKNELHMKFYTASIAALFTGLFLAISHKNIITHLIGFLIIENGIFMLSLIVGGHMPMVVNIGILLDIFTSVLILGVMVNKIASMHNDVEGDQLTKLKD